MSCVCVCVWPEGRKGRVGHSVTHIFDEQHLQNTLKERKEKKKDAGGKKEEEVGGKERERNSGTHKARGKIGAGGGGGKMGERTRVGCFSPLFSPAIAKGKGGKKKREREREREREERERGEREKREREEKERGERERRGRERRERQGEKMKRYRETICAGQKKNSPLCHNGLLIRNLCVYVCVCVCVCV